MDVKTSSIFLKNITCIDHAWCAEQSDYTIQGGSYLASFIVTGKVEQHEQVVVDFSTLKKDIKNIIDDPQIGLDHKLWLYPDAFNIDSEIKITTPTGGYQNRLILQNSSVKLDIPSNSVARVRKGFSYTLEDSTTFVKEHVQSQLELKYPGIMIECILSEIPDTIPSDEYDYEQSLTKTFRYTHGLKNSTSWACQNIVHGHLSFVTFYTREISPIKVSTIDLCLTNFIDQITDSVFIHKENIVDKIDSSLVIDYTTKERGHFKGEYDSDENKLLIFNEETTIENLTKNLIERFLDVPYLKELGVTKIAISEGLQKGSIINL